MVIVGVRKMVVGEVSQGAPGCKMRRRYPGQGHCLGSDNRARTFSWQAATEPPMALVVIGALFVIVGIAMSAVRTAERGRLTQLHAQRSAPPDTLEPTGKGQRLSFKADLPGLLIAAVGVVLIFAGAVFMNAVSAG